jgi:hypothetical protein
MLLLTSLPSSCCPLLPFSTSTGGGLVGTANLLQQGVTLASFSGVQQANVWKHIIATINSASQANQHLIKQIPGKEVSDSRTCLCILYCMFARCLLL